MAVEFLDENYDEVDTEPIIDEDLPEYAPTQQMITEWTDRRLDDLTSKGHFHKNENQFLEQVLPILKDNPNRRVMVVSFYPRYWSEDLSIALSQQVEDQVIGPAGNSIFDALKTIKQLKIGNYKDLKQVSPDRFDSKNPDIVAVLFEEYTDKNLEFNVSSVFMFIKLLLTQFNTGQALDLNPSQYDNLVKQASNCDLSMLGIELHVVNRDLENRIVLTVN